MASNLEEAPWEFNRVPGGYESRCPRYGITITAEEIKRKADEMTSLMTVRSSMLGLRTVEDDILKVGILNFYATTSRASWAKEITRRCPGEAQSLDWDGFLERFVVKVIAAERMGEAAVNLATVELSQGNRYLIPGLVSAEETSIWFGDGGAMKSYLALAAGATIASGSSDFLGVYPNERRNVGYIDWEWGAQAHRRRLGRISPDKMADILYVRCDRPLTYEVARLQRLVREHDLGFVILDSIAFGCDAPPEQADTATRYVSAVRQLGVPALLLAHVTKAEDGDKKPFGSSFWHNSTRLTWFVKKAGEYGDTSVIGMFNRKNNDDRPLEPRGFRFRFDEEANTTSIVPADEADLANEADIAERMPLKSRIAAVIRDEPKTMAQIAVEIDKTVQDVSTTVRRGEGKMFQRVMGTDNVYRIALLPTGTDGS